MRVTTFISAALTALSTLCAAQSTSGIEALVQRRLPNHADCLTFSLINASVASANNPVLSKSLDEYTVSNAHNGSIHISGNSPIALASGLRWYLNTYVHVDIYWFIGSRLHLAPSPLPHVNQTYHGSSIVPWRYHFNTVTFSYTAAFWTWEDWELELDWLALHGVNLPLAWVGYEKILTEVFLEAGFSESDVASFLSGPAFQAWNRFGNIQGSWGGELPMSWIEGQFELQKKIVKRMVELGMTPALPAFTGFVPKQIGDIYPNAAFVNGSAWNGFPTQYTNVTFLEPFDPLFAKLQKSFIAKQTAYYGNVSSIYTLDQYNENDPYSGDLDYLRNVTSNTISSLKAADSNAVWLIQGWLFYSSQDFWTDARVEAYLGGVDDSDMLILDLFSESQPQWQRTNNYYGKPWIWCQLHNYGANMGLYGQFENITINPIAALANESSTMVGMGLTMEGQETVPMNQVVYDVLLDQAWSALPIDTARYVRDWVCTRYSGAKSLPMGLYKAWETMRTTVFNNTDLETATSVTKSIFVLAPNVTGLLNRTGHHSTAIQYDPDVLVGAWKEFYGAAIEQPSLWADDAYTADLTDITRQVLANAFIPLYTAFVDVTNSSSANSSIAPAEQSGSQMISLLSDLDSVLAASEKSYINLAHWIASARAWATPISNSSSSAVISNSTSVAATASYYEYNARNQITLWGPTGQISDYASKQWAGLIRSYYIPRWQLFIDYTLNSTTASNGENDALTVALLAFEEGWQLETWGEAIDESYATDAADDLPAAIAKVVRSWDVGWS